MSRLMFACFLLGGLIPEPTPTDYCATSYCDAGLTNVGCNPPPLTGGPTCDGKEPLVIGIGQAEIDYNFRFTKHAALRIRIWSARPNLSYCKSHANPPVERRVSQTGRKQRT
uniref:Uncharacterized protein n=1 Tax=Anopheles atroparvus TaxID=41427 RepID=A0AAG5D2B6_ANOAO